jgi:D-amino-acid oxidase
VEDSSLFPIRGQIALVRNDAGGNFSLSGTADGENEGAYMMSRAAGGGTVLGGCTQKGNWESGVDFNLAVRIMARAVELCPQLIDGEGGVEMLDVVRHGVGLRPGREGGVRLEREVVGGVRVVHNYGHAGTGYQSSYVCAEVVVKLVEEVLRDGRKGV